jgi:hypothetical protein
MWTKLYREIAQARVFDGPPPEERVLAEELATLPPAAQTYVTFFGIGAQQPKHWSLRLRWTGRFRMAPTRPWMPIEAVQYDLRSPVARVFHMRARMMGIVSILARDTYVHGHGRLLARIGNVVTVADGSGPEFDEGELVTWLNDCALFAPSMLLGPGTRWLPVNDRSFEVALTDGGRTVRAHVRIDERGAPVDFETSNRFLNDPDDPKHQLIRGVWRTPIDSWQRVGAQVFPQHGRATWDLASGGFTYAEFDLDPASLAFDVPPLAPERGARAA